MSAPLKYCRFMFVLVASCLPYFCQGAGHFVEVTAQVTMNDWDFQPGIETWTGVIGLNSWMETSRFEDELTTNWFTGSKLVSTTFKTNESAWGTIRRVIHPSPDGNPDPTNYIMGDVCEKGCWLAFCSGPCFRNPNHKIYPPGIFWAESSAGNGDWKESSILFNDEMGLPQKLELITTNKQTLFEYYAPSTTNVFGWTIPLTFYGIQYRDSAGKGWRVDTMFKGRVTSIRETAEPAIPAKVLKSLH